MTAQEATELFFSEYIEGSSNNKALEIFNGTGSSVDLGAGSYSVEMYFNGSSDPGLTIDLLGTVADGDVFVLAHSSAVSDILNEGDQTNGAGWFNGDDAVVLKRDGTVIDSIGQRGSDPGSQWGSGETSTQNNTLRRQASVCAGDKDPDDAFDPSVEWEGFAEDTFAGLGSHTATCEGGEDPVASAPVINEFVANHTGSDTHEFIEIEGEPNTDYGSYAILHVEGDDNSPGTIDGVFSVGTTDANGYWDTGFMSNGLENGTLTLLLVEGFTGSQGDDLDTDDDGVLDATPWGSLVDDVAVNDGGSGDETYAGTVLAGGFDGAGFTPGGASRIPDGSDTDSVDDWSRNDFDGLGLPEFAGSADEGEAVNTPGAENELVDASAGEGDAGVCGDPATLIHDVQGSGATSPLEGDDVVVEGVVVGDFQGGDALGGFFVQEEDEDQDGDPATSEGIFVFDGDSTSSEDVSEGDTVRVAGTVEEFFDATQLGNVMDVVVCGTDGSVTASELNLPLTAEELERVENMLVVFPQQLVISEYFNFDRFGEVVLALPLDGLDRPFQPTSYAEPGSGDASDIAEAISERRITLDDGQDQQNPVFARHPNGDEFTLQNRFRGGDLVTDATGVLNYAFGLYRIQPTTGATYTSVNPRPAAPEVVGGELTVATLNVLNYFTGIDDGSDDCGPNFDQECRGADTPEELERQEAKIVAALAAMDADVVGLIEIQNNAGVVQELVDALNDEVGGATYEAIDTGAIGPDAIKVAFIYKPATVTPHGEHAVLDTPEFLDPNDLGEAKNRPALAQTFVQDSDGAIFTAVVNHLKSKGSECGTGDDDAMQGNCNLTRTLAAQELMDWIATDPTSSGDPDYLILGDLNAYDEEDPIAALEDGGYIDLGERDHGEFAYTYVFDGQFGHLDYAMANRSLELQVTGATNWHINADEPDILDYDTSFKQQPQQELYEPNAYRSSDHDPVIVGLDLNLNNFPTCSAAEPSSSTLWPPNHMMEPIELLGVTDPEGDDFTLEITSVFQDEPVDLPGDSDGDTAPDAEGVGTSTASVRAERDEDGNGRVYHIAFTATDEHFAGCIGEVQVSVPSSRGRNGSAVDDGALHDSTQLQ